MIEADARPAEVEGETPLAGPMFRFVQARLAELEAESRRWESYAIALETGETFSGGDPGFVLADTHTKHWIIGALDLTLCPCATAGACVEHDASAGPPEFARERYVSPMTNVVLRSYAGLWSDHPDYEQEWAARPGSDAWLEPPATPCVIRRMTR